MACYILKVAKKRDTDVLHATDAARFLQVLFHNLVKGVISAEYQLKS